MQEVAARGGKVLLMSDEKGVRQLSGLATWSIRLPDVAPFDYPLDAIYRVDTPPGPAATWLIERFRGQASDQGQS